MTALALIALVIAFSLFALATDPHALARLCARPGAKTRRLRRAGAWGLLALAFLLTIAAHGWRFGPVLWTGLVMVAAGIVFLSLNLLPLRVRMPK